MAKILKVDDSRIIRCDLYSIINWADHEVVAETENGLQAIKGHEKCRPDLITMDITTPVMDGVTAVKKIIARYLEALIITINAMDQKSVLTAAIQNDARNCIIKPFSPDKVVGVINAILATVGKSAIGSGSPSLHTPEDKPTIYPFHIEGHDADIRVTIQSSFASGHVKFLHDVLRHILV